MLDAAEGDIVGTRVRLLYRYTAWHIVLFPKIFDVTDICCVSSVSNTNAASAHVLSGNSNRMFSLSLVEGRVAVEQLQDSQFLHMGTSRNG